MLYKNWWPMLTGIMYVLVPMPYLFFGGGGDSYGYGSSIASGCGRGAGHLVARRGLGHRASLLCPLHASSAGWLRFHML